MAYVFCRALKPLLMNEVIVVQSRLPASKYSFEPLAMLRPGQGGASQFLHLVES
jgi:hypothetical protein